MGVQRKFIEEAPPRVSARQAGQCSSVIGVDCDGVLASGEELWEVLYRTYPDIIPPSYSALTSYEWPRKNAHTTELMQRLSSDPEFTLQLALIPQVEWALRTLNDAGWRIHIITARPDEVREVTRHWLVRHGIHSYIDEVHCQADKVPLAQSLNCCAFVEDNHKNAEEMGRAAIRSYLIDASYNQFPCKFSYRMSSWQDIVADLFAWQQHYSTRLAGVRSVSQSRRGNFRSANKLPRALPHFRLLPAVSSGK